MGKYSRSEVGKNLREHRHGALERAVTEEYPTEAGEVEGDDDGDYLLPAVRNGCLRLAFQIAPPLMACQRYAVQSAPNDKVPRGAVP